MFPNKVEVHFHMFGGSVLHRITSEVNDGTNIIIINNGSSMKWGV